MLIHALSLSVVLAAPPIVSELEGAPPRFAGSVDVISSGALAQNWFLDDGWLSSAIEAGQLFTASAQGPQGSVVGLACEVTVPAAFPIANVRASTPAFPHPLFSSTSAVYVPAPVAAPVRLQVYRDETDGKDPVGETILAVMTIGISLLRLQPSLAATVVVPRGATRGRAGNFSVECRSVGKSSVDDALAARQRQECKSLDCLKSEVSLLGAPDADVVARAQSLVDASATRAQRWRSRATWTFRSYTVEAVTRCGARCARITVRNDTAMPIELPRPDEALDAEGRTVDWSYEGFNHRVPARGRATFTASLSLRDSPAPPKFPVVGMLREDRWHERLPAEVGTGGAWFRIAAGSGCADGKMSIPVEQVLFNASAPAPDQLVYATGETSHFSVPFGFWGAVNELKVGITTVYPPSGCPRAVGVSGPVPGAVYFVVN